VIDDEWRTDDASRSDSVKLFVNILGQPYGTLIDTSDGQERVLFKLARLFLGAAIVQAAPNQAGHADPIAERLPTQAFVEFLGQENRSSTHGGIITHICLP
jgi:hypothetical protein